MMKNTEEITSSQEATPAGAEIQPPIAGAQEAPPANLPLNDNQRAEDSPLEDIVCEPENFENPEVLPNALVVEFKQHNPVLGCQLDMDAIAVERVEYDEIPENDPQCPREQQHSKVVENVKPTGFKKYRQLWWKRMKKSPLTYFVVLIINFVCVVLSSILPEISDILYCVIVVSFTCAVSTILFERASCNQKLGKIVEGCFESKNCCGKFRNEVHHQSQYIHPIDAAAIQFQHEVADSEIGNPNEPSRLYHANFESLESRSTDNTPDSPKTIDVDVHGNVRTPSHAGDTSVSSSQQEIDEQVILENKPGTSK